MDFRESFKSYVVSAIVRKAGLSRTAAAAMVERSTVGAMMAIHSEYVYYRGADYWAQNILEGERCFGDNGTI